MPRYPEDNPKCDVAEKAYIVGYKNADYSGLNQGQTQAPAAGGCAYDESYVVEQLFTYHSPTPFSAEKYNTIREAAKYFAKVLLNNVPQGADRTAAIRKLREAVMTANAGIALGGLSL